MNKSTSCSRWWTNCTQNKYEKNQKEELTDCRKSKMKKYSVKSQIRDHSNKVPTSKDFKRSTDLLISSNVRVFRSLQINHIKQVGMFQTLEECFPKQFIHAKRREAIVLSITHWISNMKKTSLHKARAANLQRSKLCYIPFNTKYLLEANHLWHCCITFTSHHQYFLFDAPTIIMRTLCKQNHIFWTPNWAPNSWLPNFSKHLFNIFLVIQQIFAEQTKFLSFERGRSVIWARVHWQNLINDLRIVYHLRCPKVRQSVFG